MKQLKLMTAVAVMAMLLASCGKKADYTSFIGTWGVEKIEYYNVDFAGLPILTTLESYTYDPENVKDGIQLVFREDKTGEMRDNNIDSVGVNWSSDTWDFEYYVYNPDTTLVYTFTYSFDSDESLLFMNMRYTYPYEYQRVFSMKVSNLTDNSFCYENEYNPNYMEKAYMKRISNTPSKAAGKAKTKHPNKPGSLFGNR